LNQKGQFVDSDQLGIVAMVRGVNGTVLNDSGNPQIGRVGWREESGGRSDVDGLDVTPCCILGQER
jgi:hypothetical protein